MIRFPLQADEARSNQIERVISDLQVNPERRMRHIYEVQLFVPGKDLRPQGFPCLSSVSLHVESETLRLAATYRNQYYVERGLGNFIGLARLQAYIAGEAGLPTGAMSVHAFHAELDRPLREARRLLADLDAL
jgi:thymidylate synthase